MALLALTRDISDSFGSCELTYLERVPIDIPRAREQHQVYVRALETLGCAVRQLPPLHECPDGVFIEDTAVVLDDVAVVTRPGARSRRPEIESAAAALASERRLLRVESPATLDGGDVIVMGRTVFVGATWRTNLAGAEQLQQLLTPLGYDVKPVAVRGCLHLKSAATALDGETLLLNPKWVRPAEFAGRACIEVDPSEPSGANTLRINDRVIYDAAHPKTAARLEQRGYKLVIVDNSELTKAEGALTCCSLVFRSGGSVVTT